MHLMLLVLWCHVVAPVDAADARRWRRRRWHFLLLLILLVLLSWSCSSCSNPGRWRWREDGRRWAKDLFLSLTCCRCQQKKIWRKRREKWWAHLCLRQPALYIPSSHTLRSRPIRVGFRGTHRLWHPPIWFWPRVLILAVLPSESAESIPF